MIIVTTDHEIVLCTLAQVMFQMKKRTYEGKPTYDVVQSSIHYQDGFGLPLIKGLTEFQARRCMVKIKDNLYKDYPSGTDIVYTESYERNSPHSKLNKKTQKES